MTQEFVKVPDNVCICKHYHQIKAPRIAQKVGLIVKGSPREKDSLKNAAKVLHSVVPLTNIDKTYCYYSEKPIKAGCRVRIPLGRQRVLGVIWSHDIQIPDGLDAKKIKTITEVIDLEPVFSADALKLATWMHEYYLYPLGPVLKTMLPASQRLSKKKYVIVNTKKLSTSVIGNEKDLITKIFSKKTSLTEQSFLKNLLKNNLTKADVNYLFQEGILLRKEQQNIVATSDPSKKRQLTKNSEAELDQKKSLTAEQSKALQQIIASSEKELVLKPFLLQGVTGSGKTEVYLQLIEHLFKKDPSSQVLVMVPEISLTPQMTNIFYKRFGPTVEIIHSNLSDSKRWASMQRIKNSTAKILIGPRSAVFTHFNNLQLIIVDEEHDQSYKQQSGVPYSGRDVAVVRAMRANIPVVLGSATPSLESYFNAQKKRYTHLRLTERVHQQEMPSIKILKTKPSFLHKKDLDEQSISGLLHAETAQAIEKTIERKKQVMIIVGRRGYANYLYSKKEEQPILCKNCSITLTFHKNMDRLICHYCHTSTALTQIYKSYPKEDLHTVGFGSEKLENSLFERFPQARIARLDSDKTSKKGVLDETLQQFKDHQLDILVGTQMLTKGHDFSKVQLVVLVELDNSLFYPDFRSTEKTFQSLIQSAGRSGRSGEKGSVFIQSFQKKSPLFNYLEKHDFDGFATEELLHRQLFNYPPYTRMCKIEFTSRNIEKINELRTELNAYIHKIEGTCVAEDSKFSFLGPSYPFVNKINKKHRLVLNILSSKPSLLHQKTSSVVGFVRTRAPSIDISVDIDPSQLI